MCFPLDGLSCHFCSFPCYATKPELTSQVVAIIYHDSVNKSRPLNEPETHMTR